MTSDQKKTVSILMQHLELASMNAESFIEHAQSALDALRSLPVEDQ